MKLSWNWLKDYVTVSASVEAVAERLTMAGLEVKKIEKVGSDYRLETEITSNRPDWLSHIGVAREIAALFNKQLKLPKISKVARGKTNTDVTVHTPDKKWCPYYSGTVLEGLSSVPTPNQMRERLEVCGLRSIHFIVDVTNYVLLECGQPLHAFDLARLSGNQISARRARSGEQMTAINGTVCKLDGNDCVIADEAKTVAIGGVMGGQESEVSTQTKNILIESAYFTPSAIRKTSKRLKLASDSSYRFERGVDPLGVDWARERAVSLIAELCKPKAVGQVLKSGKAPVIHKKVLLAIDDVVRVLGVSISSARMKQILNRLGIRTAQSGKNLVSAVPSFRNDIVQSVDLIEEIARIDGYDKIPETLPRISMTEPKSNSVLKLQENIRDFCMGLGLQETVTFSIINPDDAVKVDADQTNHVRIHNPRNQDLTLMRPNFMVSMLQVIRQNLNAGAPSVALFEIGNRYWNSGKELPIEDRTLAFALSGETAGHWMNKIRDYNFFHLKGISEALLAPFKINDESFVAQDRPYFIPGEGFKIIVNGRKIGELGSIRREKLVSFDIEKSVYFGEISLTELAEIKVSRTVFRDFDKFPKTKRDLSMVVGDQIASAQLIGAIQSLGKSLIRNIEVFDLYRGGNIEKGKKSISFRITYQAGDRTLQNEEVNALHFSIVESLTDQFSAKLH